MHEWKNVASNRTAMLIVNIKRLNSKIKVFVIADRYLEETKTRILDYGADEFVLKPISIHSVIEKVNLLLLEAATNSTSKKSGLLLKRFLFCNLFLHGKTL